MSSFLLSRHEAAELLMRVNRIAATYPTTVYNGNDACLYSPDPLNPCGCIMGAALRTMGLVPTSKEEGIGIAAFLRDDLTPTANRLSGIQHHQDLGMSWSDAVRKAEES